MPPTACRLIIFLLLIAAPFGREGADLIFMVQSACLPRGCIARAHQVR